MAKISVTYRLNIGDTRKYLKKAKIESEKIAQSLDILYDLFDKISKEDITLQPVKDEGFEKLEQDQS